MQNNSIDLQEKIINYLKESPKSFKELKNTGDSSLKNDSTLNRYLNKLKRKGYIEKEYPEERIPGIRFRYTLTNKYYNQVEKDTKRSKLENWVSSKIESQSIFNFIKHFLEDENPNLAITRNFNSFLLDIYSYIKYFNISFKKISRNPNLYINSIIYLILHHPDQKYKEYQQLIRLNRSEFDVLFDEFKSNESMEEFQFKSSIKNDKKRYLIAEDPILYNFKQQGETYFQKFLMCWEFPEINFGENFDFLYHYSHFIYDNEYSKIDSESKELRIFFRNNRICLLIFIREYLWEFLEKLELESELKPPFKLLDYSQKKEAISNILLSPTPLPSNEKKNIEIYLYSIHIGGETNLEFLKGLISKLVVRINERNDLLDKYEQENSVFYKSHLQFLLRIFQTIDNKLYQEFKKEIGSSLDFDRVKLSYSSFSNEIFEDIVNLKIGFGDKVDYEKRSFTIRFLLERIDHLENLLNMSKMGVAIAIEKIKEIYLLVLEHFSKKIQYQFAEKIQKIDVADVKSLIDPETIEQFRKTKNLEIEKKSNKKREFPFAIVFPKKEIVVENWESNLNDIQNEPLKFIEGVDQLLYTRFGFEILEKLVEFALLLLKYYGINWTIRYIDLFFNYLKWFIKRKEIMDELGDFKDNQTISNIFDFLKGVIKAVVYWEYRERGDTIQFIKEANKMYEEIKDIDNKLINNFKHRLDQLKIKIS